MITKFTNFTANMRVLEFFSALKRQPSENEVGTFVGARLDRDSEDKLIQWMKENGIKSPTPKARLHVTVIRSEGRDIPWDDMTYSPKLEIDPSSYKLAQFGDNKNMLVLKFNQPDLEKRHHDARDEHKIDWDFPQYEPHITLSDNPENDIEGMLLPSFPLFISQEYNQPYGYDDSEETDRRKESVGMVGRSTRGGYGGPAEDPEDTPYDGEKFWVDPGSGTQ